jgi:putative transposase
MMDEAHTLAAMRYVELNPVRAGLCKRPEDWEWSSVHTHLDGTENRLVDCRVVQKILPDWSTYVRASQSEDFNESIRRQTRSGRPMGDDDFLDMVEMAIGRPVRKKHPRVVPWVMTIFWIWSKWLLEGLSGRSTPDRNDPVRVTVPNKLLS